jgi:hypothetical protein
MLPKLWEFRFWKHSGRCAPVWITSLGFVSPLWGARSDDVTTVCQKKTTNNSSAIERTGSAVMCYNPKFQKQLGNSLVAQNTLWNTDSFTNISRPRDRDQKETAQTFKQIIMCNKWQLFCITLKVISIFWWLRDQNILWNWLCLGGTEVVWRCMLNHSQYLQKQGEHYKKKKVCMILQIPNWLQLSNILNFQFCHNFPLRTNIVGKCSDWYCDHTSAHTNGALRVSRRSINYSFCACKMTFVANEVG